MIHGKKQNNDGIDARVCTEDEVSKEYWDMGFLYICPPFGQLSLKNIASDFNHEFFEFEMAPNYDNQLDKKMTDEFINNLIVMRMQRELILNFQIHGPVPTQRT